MGNKPKGKVWTCMTCGAMNIQRDGVCVICGTNKDTHKKRVENTDQTQHADQTNHASSTQ
jgi:uncharacterized Zn finger protein (UPF0148 family)